MLMQQYGSFILTIPANFYGLAMAFIGLNPNLTFTLQDLGLEKSPNGLSYQV